MIMKLKMMISSQMKEIFKKFKMNLISSRRWSCRENYCYWNNRKSSYNFKPL